MASGEIKLETVVSSLFAENAYILNIHGRNDCVVVDPGLEPEKIIAHLDHYQLVPAAILLTHGHSDHIAGCAMLKQRWPDCPLVIGVNEVAKLTDPQANLSASFGFDLTAPPADVAVVHGQRYSAAGLDFEVREIPGHSAGHVVFLLADNAPPWVLVGDVIFAGSIGRTDFPDGDFEKLTQGIHRELFTLSDKTVLLPGHGPPTTVGREKQTNPFVGVQE
ncbi:MAG: MBL fold metallo-hydrolase [Pirellulaceae bacterium]|nr:MBL fold metallo-hydrolase [Pirellulaceae bacterium]